MQLTGESLIPRTRKKTPPSPHELALKAGIPGRFKFVDGQGNVIWQAQEGMQQKLFELSGNRPSRATEILLGGLRGPGKTDALIAWMAEPTQNADYRGIILRFSAEALKETIDRAWQVYKLMGARMKNRPVEFHFPSGAIVYTGHLRDERSFEDYKGHEYHRIGIEEATQIAKKELYLKLLGSNRSTVPGIVAQVCSTTNPDGPGNDWLKRRFVKVYPMRGNMLPWGERFEDPITKRIRVYIPGSITENKVLLDNDPTYYDRLRDNSPQLVKAWVEGDWDAPASQFYPEFRANGPVILGDGIKEPPEANHVVPAHPIAPWLHRWISLDYGWAHHAAAYWYANSTDSRIHVYREHVVRKLSADLMGAEIAKRTTGELERYPSGTISLYLSHECFGKQGLPHSRAEQIQVGLGPESAFILDWTDEERELRKNNPDLALQKLMQRRKQQTDYLRIVIRRCNPAREDGASYVRTLLRWKQIKQPAKPDMEYASSLMQQPDGYLKVQAYIDLFEKQKDEILPKVQIHGQNPGWDHTDNKGCQILIETIPKLMMDPDKPETVMKFDSDDDTVGDDPWDSFRFGCMAYRDHESKVPFEEWMKAELARHVAPGETDMNLKVQAAMRATAKYEKKQKRPSTIPTMPRDAMAARY